MNCKQGGGRQRGVEWMLKGCRGWGPGIAIIFYNCYPRMLCRFIQLVNYRCSEFDFACLIKICLPVRKNMPRMKQHMGNAIVSVF